MWLAEHGRGYIVGVVVRRYIDFLIIITYPYSSCIWSFGSIIPILFVHFVKSLIL